MISYLLISVVQAVSPGRVSRSVAEIFLTFFNYMIASSRHVVMRLLTLLLMFLKSTVISSLTRSAPRPPSWFLS